MNTLDHDVHDAHGHGQPHEAPWLMTFPLIALSIGAIFGGLLNLPFDSSVSYLASWLEPVFGDAEHELTMGAAAQWTFAIVSAIVAAGGIILAYLIYDKQRVRAVEPELLEHAWYYDDAVAAFVGGPGEQGFDDVLWFDEHVVDGAVNGVAAVSKQSGRGLRLLQSGYIRNYALGIALGAVLLLGWFVSRGVF